MGQGVPLDYAKAVHWLTLAAEQDYAPAMSTLGELYETGLGGEKNLGTAVRLYRRGAELGDELCAASLASLYQAGRGVKRDLAESCKWFALAALEADEGETRAAEALAALEADKELTPEVKLAARAEAEKLYKQIFGEEKLLPALKQ